jgi:shikimate kinase
MSKYAKPANIFLAGMMGTGKSSAGKLLAAMLDFEFVDTDVVIEREAQATVSEIFLKQGEPFFRARERDTLEQICRRDRQVVATGGGMLADPDNLRFAQQHGFVVLLTADNEAMIARTTRRQTRPLIARGNPAERLQEIWQQRQTVYLSIACRIDTTAHSPRDTAIAVHDAFQVWKDES